MHQKTVEGIGEGIASMQIADGSIYTLGDSEGGEFLTALDQHTAQRLWAVRLGPRVNEASDGLFPLAIFRNRHLSRAPLSPGWSLNSCGPGNFVMGSRDSPDVEEAVMTVKHSCLSVILVLLASGILQATDETSPAAEPKPEVAATVLAVGDLLPAFESIDEQGHSWKSADHVGKKILVLYFYPGDFTGGCIKQVEAYCEGLANLEELDVELVGVSGDEVATHKLFKETYGLKHTLLSDSRGELAKLVGIPVSAGGRVRPRSADRQSLVDAAGKRIVFERPVTIARWTLVVDKDRKIASLRNIVDPVTDSEEVLKIVEAQPR